MPLIKQNQPTSEVFHLVAGAVRAFYTLLCSATSYSIHPQFWLLCCRPLLKRNKTEAILAPLHCAKEKGGVFMAESIQTLMYTFELFGLFIN